MNVKKIIAGYTPDYDEICRFKNEFEKFESDMKLLREGIFNWLDKKDDIEIEDFETMLTVEIEEINKLSVVNSIVPIATFFLGIIANLYRDKGMIEIFIAIILVWISILAIGINRSTSYHKYYIFLQQMIQRYKEKKFK